MHDIRRITPDEAETLAAIAARTFSDTFAHHNTPEDMQAYISTAFSVEQLRKELSSPDSASYFVLVENEPSGYLQLNFDTTEKGLEGFTTVEIGRLYVLEKFLGHKFGKKLMEHAIAVAQERHADYLWLGVWERNYRAIAFYTQWGFEFFGSHIFQLGCDIQTDLLMKRAIARSKGNR